MNDLNLYAKILLGIFGFNILGTLYLWGKDRSPHTYGFWDFIISLIFAILLLLALGVRIYIG